MVLGIQTTLMSKDNPHSHGIYRLGRERYQIYYCNKECKTATGADCGSDHELLIAKFRLKIQTAIQTTRPFRYDLNKIPYDYTMEVRNRFKGLDLIDRVPDELWMEVYDIVHETGIKTIPKKKKTIWRFL